MKKEEESTTAHKLMEAFMRFRHLRNWKHEDARLGLRHSELMALYCIKRKTPPGSPGIKVSEISGIMRVTPPTITQILNALDEGGYIERKTDEKDRRAVRVRLTARGEQTIQKMADSFLKSFDGLVEYLGEEKGEELADLLSKVFTYFSNRRQQDL